MAFVDWITDKMIQIIIAILSGAAVYYLIQIKNQKASISNSPNSQNAQLQTGNITNSQINILKEGIKKEIAFSEEIPEKEDDPKKLIKKIEIYIDERKPISSIATMALRLAKELNMEYNEKWLENEVYGYKENLERSSRSGLKLQKVKESDKHRSIIAELKIELKNGKIESLSIPMFISQSLYDVENWINQLSAVTQGIFVLNAPPPQLMVEELKVNPDKKIPYIISNYSLNKIINGVKLKIIEFLDRAKKKVNN